MTAVGTTVRPPAVAGTFYPADPSELAATVDGLLDEAGRRLPLRLPPVALIAPHAGYRYSGPVAASAYVQLRPIADVVRRVVLLGPAHRVRVAGVGTSSADRWRTPLGDVDLDPAARATAAMLPGVVSADRAHAPEHSLEVHLPFLQRALVGPWTLCPLIVGDAPPHVVAAVLEALWDPPETLVVVSTDLSHFHDQATAERLDRDTIVRIVARSTRVAPTDACGARPLAGLLETARRLDLRLTALDVRTSGDTQGDRSRVVGYGALAVDAPDPCSAT